MDDNGSELVYRSGSEETRAGREVEVRREREGSVLGSTEASSPSFTLFLNPPTPTRE